LGFVEGHSAVSTQHSANSHHLKLPPRFNSSGLTVGRAQFESCHLYSCNGGMGAGFAESHAAAVKHNVVTIEKTMGITKKYFQLKTEIAAKQRANVQAVPRMRAKDSGGRPPSCHANTIASRRNTLTESPNPT